jgi:EmrB/QacA subfamily drug resistance transporter
MSVTKTTNPWTALAALCVGFFLIMMDTTIVNVAIPDMLADLNADLNGITWVNSVYLLAYAVPLLVAGRLGDQLGRKRVFVAGMAVFTAASLWCGLSTGVGMLVAARAVQGLGAAIMAPQTMAFIGILFPAERRGAALGAWGAVAGAATTAGPLLGGFLVSSLNWHSIFLVNVPIGIGGIIAALRLLPGEQEKRAHRFDFLGTVLCGLGLLALVFGLQNGAQYHWGTVFGPFTVPEFIGAGVLLLVAFVWWQRKNTAEPLMPLGLFRYRNFNAAVVATTTICFSLMGFYLPLTLLLQSVLLQTPWQAGLLMVPIAVGAGVMGPIAGTLSDKISGKWVVLNGFVLFAVGITMIALTAATDTNLVVLVVALAICGIATGIAFAPIANVATGDLPPQLMGAASGVFNLTRQVGSVVGTALVSVLLQAELAGAPTTDVAARQGLAHAVGSSLLLPVAVLVVGSLACLAMTARKKVVVPEVVVRHETPAKASA